MDILELQKIKNKFDIIGNDAGLIRAIETAVTVAPTELTVLITGESGVGKETIPQIIHQFSRRKTGRYLAVNCGAIPEGTINAELFGHEKGAFTGAIGERKGYFEEADGGTLFLDEIGELPKETQALLLRVLQNGEYLKVGSSKVQKTDVRIIAATNVNLAYAVATGKFREDLYYRLTGIQVQMPALRERNKDDIYLLFRKFSTDFSEKYSLCKVNLNHEAISLLTSYRWPGNIRQLKNIAETITAIESRPITASSERIELGPQVLMEYLPKEHGAMMISGPAASKSAINEEEKKSIFNAIYLLKQEVDRLKETVEMLSQEGVSNTKQGKFLIESSQINTEPLTPNEAPNWRPRYPDYAKEPTPPASLSIKKANDEMIEACLAKHNGKVKLAAEELGISERTIYRKLAKKK